MNFEELKDSGNVHSIAHDPDTQELQVRYACKGCQKTGKVNAPSLAPEDRADCPDCKGVGYANTYSYAGIPLETVQKIRTAPSAGSALHQHVVKNIQGVKL